MEILTEVGIESVVRGNKEKRGKREVFERFTIITPVGFLKT